MRERVVVVALIGQLGRGGSERQLYLSMSNLDATRFERHVVVLNPSRHAVYDDELRKAGVQVWTVPSDVRNVSQRIRYLVSFFRKIRPSVVHSWTLYVNPYAGIAGLISRVPVRWGSVRLSLSTGYYQDMSWFLRHLVLNSVTKLVVNSPTLVDELKRLSVSSRHVIYLPNAVEPNPETQHVVDLSDYDIRPTHQVVGVVANIRERKNQLMFVEAMAEVTRYCPESRGVLIGQTVSDEALYAGIVRQRIEELGLSGKVILLGFRADVADLYHSMDVFCLPSSHEGTPNALLEAMAAARPIVATAVDGISAVLRDGKSGLIVPVNDTKALASALIRVIGDSELAHELGSNAQEYVVAAHGCSSVANQLGNYYLQALDT